MNDETNGKSHLVLYQAAPDKDLRLLRWYSHLVTSGDIARTFAAGMEVPSVFLAYFQPPKVLALDFDADGEIWFAAWLEPFMQTAFFSLWCRADHRHGKGLLVNTEEAIRVSLEAFPMLLGVTPHENLLDEHRRGGYTVLGKVPGLLDGKDAYALYITRESFANREVHSFVRTDLHDAP